MRKTILVRGPALSRSGYGEQTRFALRALRSREDLFDIYLVDVQWGQTGQITEDEEFVNWVQFLLQKTNFFMSNGQKCMCSLQVTIPNEWETLCDYNVGFTAGIETTKVAPGWLTQGNEKVNSILVVSNHAKSVYENTSYRAQNKDTGEVVDNYTLNTPVKVTNYPVRTYKSSPMNLTLHTDFNFFAVAQWGPRKNMGHTVRWFVEEFHDDENVGLIVKTNIANDSINDHFHLEKKVKLEVLKDFPDRKCKIYLLHGTLKDSEMTWLYQHDKVRALVSLTHGEGFGLPLFEASYNGLPIIAPFWSGQTDFLSAKNKNGKVRPMISRVDYTIQPIPEHAVWEGVLQADSMWCYPTEPSYKKKIREFYENPATLEGMAKKLKKHVLKEFEEEKMLNNFCESFWLPAWGPLEGNDLEQSLIEFG